MSTFERRLGYAVRIAELERDPNLPPEKISNVAWDEASFQANIPIPELKQWCRGEGKPDRHQLRELCEQIHVPLWLRSALFEAAGYELDVDPVAVPTEHSFLAIYEQREMLDARLARLERENPHGYALLKRHFAAKERQAEFERCVREGRW